MGKWPDCAARCREEFAKASGFGRYLGWFFRRRVNCRRSLWRIERRRRMETSSLGGGRGGS